MIDFEDVLRDELHRAVVRPGPDADARVGAIIGEGLRSARRRNIVVVGAGTAAAVVLAVVGVSASQAGHGSAMVQAGPTAAPSASTPYLGVPFYGPWGSCDSNQYALRIDGRSLPHSSEPVVLRAGATTSIIVTPMAYSSGVIDGTAKIDIDPATATDAMVKIRHDLPSVHATADSDGTLRLRLPLAEKAHALPAGRYVIKIQYHFNCGTRPDVITQGRAISVAVR